MRRVYYILFALCIVLTSCHIKISSEEEDNSNIVQIERYDRLEYRYLTTGDFSALQQMNTEYPMETRTLIEDVVELGSATDPDINAKFLKFYQDTTLQALIASVESEYANVDDLNEQLSAAFKYLKHKLPNIDVPRIYAQISALDQSIVVGNGTVGISLDKYLGQDFPLYLKYYTPLQRQQMTRDHIVSDCLSFYLMSVYQLKDFDSRPQFERDLHIGKIHWVVNQALGHRIFRTKYVVAVENYMQEHNNVSFDELLRITDFSKFKML